MSNLETVDDARFEVDVLQSDSPVLVDFWAPWCGPCRIVHPVLEQIAAEHDQIKIVSLNIDDNPAVSSRYQVMSIPTMILFEEGIPKKTIVGAQPKRAIEAELFG